MFYLRRKNTDQGRYIYQCDNFNLKPDAESQRSGEQKQTLTNENSTSSGMEWSRAKKPPAIVNYLLDWTVGLLFFSFILRIFWG